LYLIRRFHNFSTALIADLKLALEAIYRDLFSLGLSSGDLTAVKASFKARLKSLTINTLQVDNYITALQSYLSVVVANPTDSQKTTITSTLDLFDVAEKNFVQSFYGLTNIEFDAAFAFDSRNAAFNQKRTASSAAKTTLRLNPGGTYSFFTDPATVTNFAVYNIEAIYVSNRIKSGV
jgi:hypothetical protein